MALDSLIFRIERIGLKFFLLLAFVLTPWDHYFSALAQHLKPDSTLSAGIDIDKILAKFTHIDLEKSDARMGDIFGIP